MIFSNQGLKNDNHDYSIEFNLNRILILFKDLETINKLNVSLLEHMFLYRKKKYIS